MYWVWLRISLAAAKVSAIRPDYGGAYHLPNKQGEQPTPLSSSFLPNMDKSASTELSAHETSQSHTHKLFRFEYFHLFFRTFPSLMTDKNRSVKTCANCLKADAQNGRIVHFSKIKKKTFSFIAFSAEKRRKGFICATGNNFSRNNNFASRWFNEWEHYSKYVCFVAQICLICLLVVHVRNFIWNIHETSIPDISVCLRRLVAVQFCCGDWLGQNRIVAKNQEVVFLSVVLFAIYTGLIMSLKGLTACSSQDSSSLLVRPRLPRGYDSCQNNDTHAKRPTLVWTLLKNVNRLKYFACHGHCILRVGNNTNKRELLPILITEPLGPCSSNTRDTTNSAIQLSRLPNRISINNFACNLIETKAKESQKITFPINFHVFIDFIGFAGRCMLLHAVYMRASCCHDFSTEHNSICCQIKF